jgi:hypothetical protein
VRDVLLVTMEHGCGGGCACDAGACGTSACGAGAGGDLAGLPAAVLACRDALRADGASVEVLRTRCDADLDAAIARLDGPARDDGLTWPAEPGRVPQLVVAADSDGQLRAVLRRMVRRWAPPPSRRPADLPAGRTVPDLPPLAVLPLDAPHTGPDASAAGAEAGAGALDLAGRLGLPRDPAEVAKAALHGRILRLDLLRNDGGSVTAHGALLGGTHPWSARVEVDDVLLASPDEALLACAIANADGYGTVGGLPLAPDADPTDGVVTVAVAVPVVGRAFLRRRVRVEVRRVTGRAVSVTPGSDVPYLDDGVAGTLGRKRSWWTERAVWAVLRQ